MAFLVALEPSTWSPSAQQGELWVLLPGSCPGCAGQGRRVTPSPGNSLGLLGPAAAQTAGAQRTFWRCSGFMPQPAAGLALPQGSCRASGPEVLAPAAPAPLASVGSAGPVV